MYCAIVYNNSLVTGGIDKVMGPYDTSGESKQEAELYLTNLYKSTCILAEKMFIVYELYGDNGDS